MLNWFIQFIHNKNFWFYVPNRQYTPYEILLLTHDRVISDFQIYVAR